MNQDDSQLVKQCLGGDSSAQERLYARYARWLKVYFLRSGFAATEADDLLQEVFLRAFRALGGFDPARGSLSGWLAAIARNTARKHWRKRSRPDDLDPQLAEETLADPSAPPPGPEHAEELAALRDCIDRLGGKLGRYVRLRYVEGLTTRALADRVGVPEATVRLRLAEAKQRLAACLKTKGVWD